MFSVIITTHNRQNEFLSALKSVLMQSHKPDEIIIIDDGSVPKIKLSKEVHNHSEIDIKLHRNAEPLGVSAARNQGIQLSQSPWIAFLDDDDLFHTDKIKKIKRVIDQRPEVEFIYHTCNFHYKNENVSYDTKITSLDNDLSLFYNLLISNCVGGTPMVVMRRSIALKYGGFNEDMSSLEDHEFWIRLSKNKVKFLGVDEALSKCICTTKKKSVSKLKSAGLSGLDKIADIYAEDYSKFNNNLRHRYETFRLQHLIYHHIVKYNYFEIIIYSIKLMLHQPSLKNFGLALLSFWGPSLIIRVRSIIK